MALERINPSDIYPPVNNNYTQVIKSTGGTQVHVAGIISLNKQGELIGRDDMQAQARAIVEITGKALTAAGATPANVVRMNIYTVDVDRFKQEGHREVLKFFDGLLPASTLVGVTQLAHPDFLVEIEMTAIID